MKTDDQKYRKTPPYMTKAGIKIGLLYQEPFEARIDKDAYKLQRALLAQKHKPVNRFQLTPDMLVVIVCVIILIGFIIGGFYGWL
jgi:hypothetical protein